MSESHPQALLCHFIFVSMVFSEFLLQPAEDPRWREVGFMKVGVQKHRDLLNVDVFLA
jgi:hypothetical protein